MRIFIKHLGLLTLPLMWAKTGDLLANGILQVNEAKLKHYRSSADNCLFLHFSSGKKKFASLFRSKRLNINQTILGNGGIAWWRTRSFTESTAFRLHLNYKSVVQFRASETHVCMSHEWKYLQTYLSKEKHA